MKLKIWRWYFFYFFVAGRVHCIPESLLFDWNVTEAQFLDQRNDVSSYEIKLATPIRFYGSRFDSIFVNSNGLLSFQTEIPQYINIEFPLVYSIIAPLYSHVDTRRGGRISYYETQDPYLLKRAAQDVHESFLESGSFQPTSLFIASWKEVGYYNQGSDKLNTFQVVLITDGQETYCELLYPERGIQWIQGTGDESGLPDARAQVGFLSENNKMFTLPGSGTEQVRNLVRWSNMGFPGQFIYRVDGAEIQEPNFHNEGNPVVKDPQTCSEAATACHVQAQCVDFDEGFCCECIHNYYGNGKYCINSNLPLRVMGKVNGVINGHPLENLDLQSYIVTSDGRTYTALSKVPEPIGRDIQTLQVLGGSIAYLFAKPSRGAQNGFQITGGHFNYSAKITFVETNQVVTINQKFLGLDVHDQLSVESTIHGDIPRLSPEAQVIVDQYKEQYTQTGYNLIQMSSDREYSYSTVTGEQIRGVMKIEQTFKFDYCPHKNNSIGESWNLNVERNFISYEDKEQIIRFGLTNEITPIGGYDPCEEGKHRCGENSNCVVEGDRYKCVCVPGYQSLYAGADTVCVDVNECQTGLHNCDYNAQCVNNVGSYSCTCNPGYEGDGRTCQNSASCENVTCSENAECVEYPGGASCRCLQGFRGNGLVCRPEPTRPGPSRPPPVQDCRVTQNCSPHAQCIVYAEGALCICDGGYEGDGYDCEPQEQYQSTQYPEEETTLPAPTQGQDDQHKIYQSCFSGVCYCPEGYQKEYGTRYCLLSNAPAPQTQTSTESAQVENCALHYNCDANAECMQDGIFSSTYACVCKGGFEGDGHTCHPEQVSCTKEDNCHVDATCTYDEQLGKSRCVCNFGYTGDGYDHCDIDSPCRADSDCDEAEECTFVSSRYECVCKQGYFRDSQNICVPFEDEDSCGGAKCVENAECLFDEVYGTNYCLCKEGYIGDGITECKLKPVGCDVLNNCHLHATCRYEDDAHTYICRCKPGFYGDGLNCDLERNCLVEPSLCDSNAACVSDAERRYACLCNPGYVGNGTACKEISNQEGNFLLVNQGMATVKIPLEPSKKNQGKPIQVQLFQTAVGLDIDCLEGRVYWSDISGRAIRSATYNGSDKIDFITKEIGSPEGLAVDWVSRNIYWTDSTHDTVEVANLDSRRRRTLIRSGLVNPRGIAVHPQRGKIFWTDWDRTHPKIEWANADGSNRQIFLEGPAVSLPNSLAIDYDTEQLCYSDAGTKKIECVYIDNKQIQTIAVNCTYPFGIAVTDKNLYWSDWVSKKIEQVDKYNLSRQFPLIVPTLGGSANKLFGLVAVPTRCPRLTNICEYGRMQCPDEHICLPNGFGGKNCACAARSDSDELPNCVL